MATFLLDTQAVVWFNLSDARLTAAARQVIVDPGNRIWISPASYWEIAIKISRGKFSVVGPYDTFWQETIDRNRFEILPVEIRHAARLIGLPFHHRDPFDRPLAAQALAEDVPLVSSDSAFDRYGVRRVW